jgi:hypothetical protein
MFDLDDSCLKPGGESGVSAQFVQDKCRYYGLLGAACMGEGCGPCNIDDCVCVLVSCGWLWV